MNIQSKIQLHSPNTFLVIVVTVSKKIVLRKTRLRGLGSQKIEFFIPFFNSITIQKVNAKVVNRLDEK